MSQDKIKKNNVDKKKIDRIHIFVLILLDRMDKKISYTPVRRSPFSSMVLQKNMLDIKKALDKEIPFYLFSLSYLWMC